MANWMLRQCSIDIVPIAEELNIDPVIAQLLYVRGHKTSDEMRSFLNAEVNELPSCFRFKDMNKAIKLVFEAIAADKKIAVFGDYDVDGIMSTVILCKVLRTFGGDIMYYIPQREQEGYGLNNGAIRSLVDSGISLIVTCDNGISALEQVAFARSLDADVIIIDHHDVQFDLDNPQQELLPCAAAIVNPKQKDCPYPFKAYCAGGLAYRFAEAMCFGAGDSGVQLGENIWISIKEELLLLASLATVCDIVDLKEDNRTIVKQGLAAFPDCRNLGLRTLIAACGMTPEGISTYSIGYAIGPCINASGRLEIANIAAELFLTEDLTEAADLTEKLLQLNNSRKTLTSQGIDFVLNDIYLHDNYKDDKILVIYHPEIHPSISGIVAGKVKEKYYKPTVILAGDKDTVKGSCRSVEGYNIFHALLKCRDLLEAFGGHPMAAGLSIKKDLIAALRERLNLECEVDEFIQTIYIDKQLNIYNASLSLVQQMQAMEPFGKSNSRPLFADKNIFVRRAFLLGQNKRVLKLNCSKQGNNVIVNIISFNDGDKFRDSVISHYGDAVWQELLQGKGLGIPMDIIYSLEINNYNNMVSEQLRLIDFRLS